MSDWIVGESLRTTARPIRNGELDESLALWAFYSRQNGGSLEYLQGDDSFDAAYHEFALTLLTDGYSRTFAAPSSADGSIVREAIRCSDPRFVFEASDHRVETPAAPGGDWTADERAQIRSALGIDGARTATDGSELEEKLDEIKAKTDLLGDNMNVTVTSPVSANGKKLTLVRGDDYYLTDQANRDVAFVNSDGDWPNLTDAAVNLSLRARSRDEAVFTVPGVVVAPVGPPQRVRFDLPTADTAQLDDQGYAFDVEATLAGGHRVTLVLGDATVLLDSTR